MILITIIVAIITLGAIIVGGIDDVERIVNNSVNRICSAIESKNKGDR